MAPKVAKVRPGLLVAAHAAGKQHEPLRALDEGLFGADLPLHHVGKIVFGRQSEQEVCVREPRIEIHEQHALAAPRSKGREVRGDDALARAPLAAGHAEHARARPRILFARAPFQPEQALVGPEAPTALLRAIGLLDIGARQESVPRVGSLGANALPDSRRIGWL